MIQFNKRIVFLLVFAALGLIAIRNFFILSKDMIHGDLSGEAVFPQAMYGFFRIPDRANTIAHNAVNRLAADFAQVYFPAQEFSALSDNYETGVFDPWWRPSRYAPVIHYICAVTICRLDYGYASFIHMLVQLILFYLFYVMAFKMLEIEKDLPLGLAITSLFLFATPAGVSWFERGQFSLYVGLSHLLLIVGLIKNRLPLIVLSAFLGYVKWTSFPFLFVILAIYWLGAQNAKDVIGNTQKVLTYLLVILALSLAFQSRFLHFIEGLYWQEIHAQPEGISLTRLLPATLVKWLPLALIFIGYLHLRRSEQGFAGLPVVLTGMGILMLTYPTIAHEYNLPSLFGFIPLIFHWAKPSTLLRQIVKYSFLSFILLASFSNYFKPAIHESGVLIGYLAAAILFLALPLIREDKTAFARTYT